jgi:hypothetical protein
MRGAGAAVVGLVLAVVLMLFSTLAVLALATAAALGRALSRAPGGG